MQWHQLDDMQTIWYGHVLRKDDDDWVKKCTEYEVEGSRPRGRPKKTWKEVGIGIPSPTHSFTLG